MLRHNISPMSIPINLSKKYLNRLLFRKALLNVGINILLNFMIQYFSLKDYDVLAVFGNGQSLARVFLPLTFLLPFFVTLDTIGFIKKMMKKKKINHVFQSGFNPIVFASKLGALNGLLMVVISFVILSVVHSLIQDQVFFNKNIVLVFQVTLSGFLAIIFTYQPFFLLKKRNLLQYYP